VQHYWRGEGGCSLQLPEHGNGVDEAHVVVVEVGEARERGDGEGVHPRDAQDGDHLAEQALADVVMHDGLHTPMAVHGEGEGQEGLDSGGGGHHGQGERPQQGAGQQPLCGPQLHVVAARVAHAQHAGALLGKQLQQR